MTFKDYYKNQDYRTKHLNYLKEKVECECGCILARVNMYRHRESEKHLMLLNCQTMEEYHNKKLFKDSGFDKIDNFF